MKKETVGSASQLLEGRRNLVCYVCPLGYLFFFLYSCKGIIGTERKSHLQLVGHSPYLGDSSKAESSLFKNNYENKIHLELSSI